MNRRYRYRLDRKCYYWTLFHLIFYSVLGFGILLYFGTLIAAWYVSFVVAAVILMLLSVPRCIEVDSDMFKINCLLDITEIPIADIRSVRGVTPRDLRWTIPIFGGCGFFGYYGHYFDFREFHRVLIYATEWRNFVEIVDVYEDCYYVSCRDAEALIAELTFKIASVRD